MKQDICSIPVSEIFEPMDGCPFCTMRNMLEDRMATYVTGAAMMEPDVRIQTNKLGFCKTHFDQILARGSRLSVALILESLLNEVSTDLLTLDTPIKKIAQKGKERQGTCFICENIDKNMINLTKNTLALWQNEAEFRELYSKQTHICVSHYSMVMDLAVKNINRKNLPAFTSVTHSLCQKYMEEVSGDITHFCRMFDYRNAGGDWGNSRDSIERAIEFLTAREVVASTQTEGKNR